MLRFLDWLFGKSTKTYVIIFAVLGAVGFIGNIVTNHRIQYVFPPDVVYPYVYAHPLFWSCAWVGLNLVLYTALNGAIWGGIFAAIAALYRALRDINTQ